jgi:positive regulator of sigma E activity
MRSNSSLIMNLFPCVLFFALAIIMSSVFDQAKVAAMCGFFAGYFACRSQDKKVPLNYLEGDRL